VISYETFRATSIQSAVCIMGAAFSAARALKLLVSHDVELDQLISSWDFPTEFPQDIPR